MTPSQFRKALEGLINEHSMENGSDTPDYILATFLSDCLHSFDAAVAARERFYGRKASEDICQSTCGEAHRYDVTCCFGPSSGITKTSDEFGGKSVRID